MKFAWHTLPVNEKIPEPKDHFEVPVDSTEYAYERASNEQKNVLNRLAEHLYNVGFEPPVSYDELFYKYKDNHGNKDPEHLSYQRLFVHCVSWNNLSYAASNTNFIWDKPKEKQFPSNDCQGRTYTIYSTKTKDYGGGEYFNRDPIHNWGIIEERDYIQGMDMVIRRIWACCGLPDKHPGCWLGETKYKIQHYDPAPGFGDEVWKHMLTKQDKDSFIKLWNSKEIIQGTIWVDREYYINLHKEIRTKKPKIGELLHSLLKKEYEQKDKDEDYEIRNMTISNFDYIDFVNLVEEYNKIYCLKTPTDILKFETVGRNTWTKEEFSGIMINGQRYPVLKGINSWKQLQDMKETKDLVDKSNITDQLKKDIKNILSNTETLAKSISMYVENKYKELYTTNITNNLKNIPPKILRDELDISITQIPDNPSKDVSEIKQFIKKLGDNSTASKDINELQTIYNLIKKLEEQYKNIENENKTLYENVKNKYDIILQHKDETMTYIQIENETKPQIIKNEEELKTIINQVKDLDNPNNEIKEYNEENKKYEEEYEKLKKTYGPIIKTLKDNKAKWSNNLNNYINDPISKDFILLKNNWEKVFVIVKGKLEKRIEKHKEDKIRKEKEQREQEIKQAEEDSKKDVDKVKVDSVELQQLFNKELNKKENEQLKQDLITHMKDLNSNMNYKPTNIKTDQTNMKSSQNNVKISVQYFQLILKLKDNGNLLVDAADKLKKALDKLVDEIKKTKQEDDKNTINDAVEEEYKLINWLFNDHKEPKVYNWLSNIEYIISGSANGLSKEKGLFDYLKNYSLTQSIKDNLVLKKMFTKDKNVPLRLIDDNELKNAIFNNNKLVYVQGDDEILYVGNNYEKVYQNWFNFYQYLLHRNTKLDVQYLNDFNNNFYDFPEQPNSINIENTKVDLIDNRTVPKVKEDVKSMFNYDSIKWANFSCWMDSVFMSMFGFVGTKPAEEIFNVKSLDILKKVIKFPSGKSINFATECDENSLKNFHKSIKNDIINIQEQQGYCVLSTMKSWWNNPCIDKNKRPKNFGDPYDPDSVVEELTRLYNLKTVGNNFVDLNKFPLKVTIVGFNNDVDIHYVFISEKNKFENLSVVLDPQLKQGEFICGSIIGYNGGHFATYMYDFYNDEWYLVNILKEDKTDRKKIDYLLDNLFDYSSGVEFKPYALVFYRITTIKSILTTKKDPKTFEQHLEIYYKKSKVQPPEEQKQFTLINRPLWEQFQDGILNPPGLLNKIQNNYTNDKISKLIGYNNYYEESILKFSHNEHERDAQYIPLDLWNNVPRRRALGFAYAKFEEYLETGATDKQLLFDIIRGLQIARIPYAESQELKTLWEKYNKELIELEYIQGERLPFNNEKEKIEFEEKVLKNLDKKDPNKFMIAIITLNKFRKK